MFFSYVIIFGFCLMMFIIALLILAFRWWADDYNGDDEDDGYTNHTVVHLITLPATAVYTNIIVIHSLNVLLRRSMRPDLLAIVSSCRLCPSPISR